MTKPRGLEQAWPQGLAPAVCTLRSRLCAQFLLLQKGGGWPEALLNLLFEHPYNFFIDTVQPMLLFNMGNEPQYFNKKVI